MKIIFLLITTFFCLQAAIRFWPLSFSLWNNSSLTSSLSEVTKLGGYYTIQKKISFEDLRKNILKTSQLKIISDGTPFVAVVRSWFWGFPDLIEVWLDGEWVHVRGHLMIGIYDFGTNKKRILAWLDS